MISLRGLVLSIFIVLQNEDQRLLILIDQIFINFVISDQFFHLKAATKNFLYRFSIIMKLA